MEAEEKEYPGEVRAEKNRLKEQGKSRTEADISVAVVVAGGHPDGRRGSHDNGRRESWCGCDWVALVGRRVAPRVGGVGAAVGRGVSVVGGGVHVGVVRSSRARGGRVGGGRRVGGGASATVSVLGRLDLPRGGVALEESGESRRRGKWRGRG